MEPTASLSTVMCFSYEALNSAGEISGLRATKAAIVKDMMAVKTAEEV